MLPEPKTLQIELLADTHAPRLLLMGEMDAASADLLLTEADRFVRDGSRHLILDCAGLTFCDSYGLRAMTELSERVRPDGAVTIANPSSTLVRLLEVTGLNAHFVIGAPSA